MRRRGWLVVLSVCLGLIVLAAVLVAAWPAIVRAALVIGVRAATGRQVAVESASLDLFRGRLAVRGFKLADRDGGPFADVQNLDAHVAMRALLRGHLHVRDLRIHDSTVRVVRFSDGDFNLSDLVRGGGGKGKRLDVTVDHFALTRGTVSLEDRMLSPTRRWRSEGITLEARDVSTLKGGGTATGSSTLDGSPVSVRIDDLRLEPVHLRVVVDFGQVDLAVARLYLPPDAPITLERARLDTRITVSFDARAGLRLDADGRLADVVVLRRYQREPFVVAPDLRIAIREFAAGATGLTLARVELSGDARVFDPDIKPAARFDIRRLRAVAEALTWPVRSPARVDVSAIVPGEGQIRARGTVSMRPSRAELAVRLTGLKLAAGAQYLPSTARVGGRADAELDVVVARAPEIQASVRGRAALARVVVADAQRPVLTVERAEAAGIEGTWPERLAVARITVNRPVAFVERDERGELTLRSLLAPRPSNGAANAAGSPAGTNGSTASNGQPAGGNGAMALRFGQILVEDGAMRFVDRTVSPPYAEELSRLTMRATGIGTGSVAPAKIEMRPSVRGARWLFGAPRGHSTAPWRWISPPRCATSPSLA